LDTDTIVEKKTAQETERREAERSDASFIVARDASGYPMVFFGSAD
jgi:hypothetical protein